MVTRQRVIKTQKESSRVMLHICCAPDATVPWPALAGEFDYVAGYFYGSNIHPAKEFLKRRDAVRRLAALLGKKLFEGPYDPQDWLNEIHLWCKGTGLLADEGGARCALCFRKQMEAAACAALDHGYDSLCTTLTISPRKDPAIVNAIGAAVSKRHGLTWIDKIWRRQGGFVLSVRKSREFGLYRQHYCGCVFSIRGEQNEGK